MTIEAADLFKMTQRACLGFINEVYTEELKAYTKRYNELEESERWQIGAAFCAFSSEQPKRKALYFSFLERQECKDPKNYQNVLRFLTEMKIKTEFQSN